MRKHKLILLIVVLLGVYVFGVHRGKQVQRERHSQRIRQRASNQSLFAKNRSKGASWPKSIEYITDVIGDGVNLVLNK